MSDEVEPTGYDQPPLLHVYGPSFWHDSVRIIGNIDGLIALRDALNDTLKEGYRNAENSAMTSDGEYFHIEVLKYDKQWKDWDVVALPYTEDTAIDRREGIKHLIELKNEEQVKERTMG